MIHTVKGFGIVNKPELDVFLEPSCFFNDPADIGNLISGSSAFSKTTLNIWNFTVHILLKPGLENFEDYFTSLDTILKTRDITLPTKIRLVKAMVFPVVTAEFSKCAGIVSAALSQHHLSGFEIAQLNSITSTSFVHSDAF